MGGALLTVPSAPQRPTDEEGFLPPPGEKSSENYQIVKGVSGGPAAVLSPPCDSWPAAWTWSSLSLSRDSRPSKGPDGTSLGLWDLGKCHVGCHSSSGCSGVPRRM